ncbi:MAG: hypothetical protein RL369_1074 [Pseudomonadota bacterium]|jgi:hypothetical protein
MRINLPPMNPLRRPRRPNERQRQRQPMSFDPEQLRARVVALEIEHRDLDEAIARLTDLPNRDDLLLTRMKKRKLQLKDQILQLKMLLVPDIPA